MISAILASISGALLILIFPKFNIYWLAYVALVPLLVSIRRSSSVDEAGSCGFLCGMIYFGGTLYWINVLSKWAGSWAILAWVALVIFQALFISAFAAAYKYGLIKYPRHTMIVAPLLWALIEWIRSLGPYGVTGGGLGYSQADLLPVLQIASLFGTYGISFLIVLVNEAATEAIVEKKWKNLAAAALVFLLCAGLGYYRISSYRQSGRELSVAVIQPDIAQDVKLDYGLAYEITDTHEIISRKALEEKPDIVIWPETAVTTYLFESNRILPKVKALIRDSHAFYLIGTPYREKSKIYNSLAAFSKNGELIGRYDKQRLVAFGEYLPLRPLFYRMLQENPLFAEDYNSNPDPKVIDLGIVKVGAVICFESTFPYLVRDKVRKGAQFILVVTNDAWFFDTAALYQHIQAARLRAVESNMYVVQAANTGLSAIIDPLGRVVKRSDSGRATILLGKIYVH